MRPYFIAVLAALGSLYAVGCGRSDKIDHYTVPSVAEQSGPRDEGGEPALLLGAIIPRGERTWFFKAVGDPVELQGEVEPFRTFIESVRFSQEQEADSAPKWSVPAGWREQQGTGMRHATLQLGSEDKPTELTVIALPTPEDNDDYLLSNINRWREQLGLSAVDADQLASQTEKVPLDECEATLVRISGLRPVADQMSTQGTFASVAPERHFESPVTPPAGSEIHCTPPKEWSIGEVTGMRKAAYVVEAEGRRVEITVIDLTAEVAELLPNVNRWREQLQLKAMTAAELADGLRPMEVGGAVGHFVEIVGPKGSQPRQTIFATVVLRGGRAWFFKLFGDAELAAAEKNRFESFVRSVRFSDS